jgi:sec-independent protein translocase protein TatA
MPHFSFPELIIIMVVILLLFGAKRIPEIAVWLGKVIKEFKKQMNDAERSIKGTESEFNAPRLTQDELAQSKTSETVEPKRLIS